MATYVYSDPHFDSEKIIVNGQRPFNNIAHMNQTLIKNYNSVVQKQDVCYWLGDVMYGATKEKVYKILHQMNGRKYLILGNHDRGHSETWWRDCGFDKVFLHPVYIAEQYIMLSHEPLPEFGDTSPIANIHGHIHIQDYDFANHANCINVCVEQTGYKPVLLQNPFLATPRQFAR
ncbi:MAG: metallophosphoesterase [Alphaproteobacteria bacterium]|nr:metallophosphoesterase [Alphaproteobacteria bacterium]